MELLIEPLIVLIAEMALPVIIGVGTLLAEAVFLVLQIIAGILELVLRPMLGDVRMPWSRKGTLAEGRVVTLPPEDPTASPDAEAPTVERAARGGATTDAARVDAARVDEAAAAAPAAIADDAPQPTPARPFRWRRLAIAALAFAGTFLIVDQVILSLLANRAVASLQAARGFTLEWDALTGHPLTGDVTLEGVRIARPDHPRSVVDLQIERIEADIAVLSLIGSDPIVIERAALHGVKGSLERTGPRQPRPPSRGFIVEELALSAIDAQIGDRTGETPIGARVQVEQLAVKPFRRSMTGFDLFFNAQGDGAIDGHPFTARQTGSGALLTFEDLPGELAGAWIGGPLAWLQTANVDLKIVYASPSDDGDHRFAMEVHLDGLSLAEPPERSMRWRLATKPIRIWLEGRDPALTLQLSSRATERELEESGRSPPRLFARLARTALTDALAEKAGVAGEVLGTISEIMRALRR